MFGAKKLVWGIAMLAGAVTAHGDFLVNQDPTTGPYGGAWLTQKHQQVLADSFTLSQNATISGYDFFGNNPGASITTQYEFNLYADSGSNSPGTVLKTVVLTPTSYTFWGVFGVSTWVSAFDLAPISVTANTKYWTSVAATTFGQGIASVQPSSNGDSMDSSSQFDGAWDTNNQIGDLCYRLRGSAVPEPTSLAVLGVGALAFLRRRARR